MDRLQASEGGETPANIFAGLDENHNGAIDGQELRVLSEKVAAALKSQRAAPDATAAKTSGRGGGRKRTLSPELDALIEQAAGSGEAGVSVAQFMEFWSSQGHAEEMGKDGFRLFKELDLDKSGALSAEELTGYKSLLYTGRTHADRAGERTWQDHESRDPRKAPPSQGLGEAGGKDLTFAEFEERYRDQVTNEKQPHGHHRAFIACVDSQHCFNCSAWPYAAPLFAFSLTRAAY